jgi:hypothetical protein
MGSRTAALLCAFVLLLGACAGEGRDGATDAEQEGVVLPESTYPPDIQCLVEQGWTIVESGGDGAHALRAPGAVSAEEREGIQRECGSLRPEPVEQTEAEVRQVYERWLAEADCLRGLGYSPDPAPPFEVFLADWRGSGPWFPIDGIDTGAWTFEQYEEAKESCVLEAFEIDVSRPGQ